MFSLNEKNGYELQHRTDFAIRTVNSVHNSPESFSYLGAKVFKIKLLYLKQTKSLSKFKAKIKKWNPQNRSCQLCKT